MHRGAALRHQAGDDPAAPPCSNSSRASWLTAWSGGPLAHADEHDALADRHHVAALERGAGEVLVGIAEPDLEIAALEVGWNL